MSSDLNLMNPYIFESYYNILISDLSKCTDFPSIIRFMTFSNFIKITKNEKLYDIYDINYIEELQNFIILLVDDNNKIINYQSQNIGNIMELINIESWIQSTNNLIQLYKIIKKNYSYHNEYLLYLQFLESSQFNKLFNDCIQDKLINYEKLNSLYINCNSSTLYLYNQIIKILNEKYCEKEIINSIKYLNNHNQMCFLLLGFYKSMNKN